MLYPLFCYNNYLYCHASRGPMALERPIKYLTLFDLTRVADKINLWSLYDRLDMWTSEEVRNFYLTKMYRAWEPNNPNLYLYHKTSDISQSLKDYKVVDHSDVVGTSPVGATPNTSLFSTQHLASMDWAKTTARRVAYRF